MRNASAGGLSTPHSLRPCACPLRHEDIFRPIGVLEESPEPRIHELGPFPARFSGFGEHRDCQRCSRTTAVPARWPVTSRTTRPSTQSSALAARPSAVRASDLQQPGRAAFKVVELRWLVDVDRRISTRVRMPTAGSSWVGNPVACQRLGLGSDFESGRCKERARALLSRPCWGYWFGARVGV